MGVERMASGTRVGVVCYAGYTLGLSLIGLMFLSRAEFLPMHAAMVGMSWPDVPPTFQVLISTMMKTIGGLYLAVAVGMVLILLGPFRRGDQWGVSAAAVLAGVGLLGPVSAMIYLHIHAAIRPPWGVPIVLGILAILGAVLSRSRSGAPLQEVV